MVSKTLTNKSVYYLFLSLYWIDKQLKYHLLFHLRRTRKSYKEIITGIHKTISPVTSDMVFAVRTCSPDGVFIACSIQEDDAMKFIVEMEKQKWKKLCGLDIDKVTFGLITVYLQHSKGKKENIEY